MEELQKENSHEFEETEDIEDRFRVLKTIRDQKLQELFGSISKEMKIKSDNFHLVNVIHLEYIGIITYYFSI